MNTTSQPQYRLTRLKLRSTKAYEAPSSRATVAIVHSLRSWAESRGSRVERPPSRPRSALGFLFVVVGVLHAPAGQPHERVLERGRLAVDLAALLERGWRVEGDDLAVVDDRQPVAQPVGLAHVVAGQQDGRVVPL